MALRWHAFATRLGRLSAILFLIASEAFAVTRIGSSFAEKVRSASEGKGDRTSRLVSPLPAGNWFGKWERTNNLVGLTVATRANALKGAEVGPLCGCTSDFSSKPDMSGLRAISDEHCAEDGSEDGSSTKMSNYVWAFGQFLVHDLFESINQLNPFDSVPGALVPGRSFSFKLTPPGGGTPATMVVRRLEVARGRGGCRLPLSAQTPLLDASQIYSSRPAYLRGTLREPGDSCRLIVGPGDMLPLTEAVGPAGSPTFITGDSRASEHIGLLSLHILFVREHNRICGLIAKRAGDRKSKWGPVYAAMPANKQFELARKVVVAKLQQITVKEWLPVLGITKAAILATAPKREGPSMSLEFHAVASRFGDDMVPDTVGKFRLLDLFGAERYLGVRPDGTYDVPAANRKFEAVVRAFATSRSAPADGKISDFLRNTVFAKFGFDIVTTNLCRGRELLVQPYSKLAACFGVKPDAKVAKETPDSWLAMCRESRRAGERISPLGSAIIKEQFRRTLFGEGGHWWGDAPEQLQGFGWQVRRATLARLIADNTNLAVKRSAKLFEV